MLLISPLMPVPEVYLENDVHVLQYQDDFRLAGSWTDRHVLLFHRAILLTKKLRDGSLQTKAVLRVSVDCCKYCKNVKFLRALNFREFAKFGKLNTCESGQ